MKRLFVLATAAALSFACGPSGKLTGKVTVTGGDPSAVTVSLSGAASKVAAVQADGTYAFDSLPDGDYLVEAFAPSTMEERQTARADVKSGSGTAQDLTFQGVGRISGRVSAPTGVAGAEVFVAGTSQRLVLADDGTFTFKNVPSGTVTLAAVKDGYDPASINVQVPFNAEAQNQNLALSTVAKGSGKISGYARFFNKTDHSGITVQVAENPAISTTTDASGSYTLIGAPLGYVTLKFLAQGYEPRTVQNVLSAQGGVLRPQDVTLSYAHPILEGSLIAATQSPDQSKLIAVARAPFSDTSSLYVLDLVAGTSKRVADSFPSAGLTARWREDQKRAVVISNSNTRELWALNVETGELKLMTAQARILYSLFLEFGGEKVFYEVADENGQPVLAQFDFATGQSTTIDRTTSLNSSCTGITYGPLYSSSEFDASSAGKVVYRIPSGTVREWNGTISRDLPTGINCVSYSGANETLVSVRDDGSNYEILNLNGASPVSLLNKPTSSIYRVALTSDGRYALMTWADSAAGQIRVFSAPIAGGSPLELFASSSNAAFLLQPGGSHLAIYNGPSIKLVDASGVDGQTFNGAGGALMAWSPAGKRFSFLWGAAQELWLADPMNVIPAQNLGIAPPDYGVPPIRFSPKDGYAAWRQSPSTTRLTRIAGYANVDLPSDSVAPYTNIVFGPNDQLALVRDANTDRIASLSTMGFKDVQRSLFALSGSGVSFAADDTQLFARENTSYDSPVFSVKPDGTFVRIATLDSGSAWPLPGGHSIAIIDQGSGASPPGVYTVTAP